ncbi:hypothetical protein H0O00_03935 [Candidatus Micrarchaeota archaeon]|nr:hypothetical protein [Candidatus Micrarchaeota archaeon]
MASVCAEPQPRIARANAPALAMANRFSRYKPEEEKAVRKVEVVEDETLKKIKEAWKACNYDFDSAHTYAKMLEAVKKLEYSAKDVENFSIALAEFQDEEMFPDKAGLFFTVLINYGKDSDYVIHTAHLAEPIDYLGYYNTKNITVKGNTRYRVGYGMKGGTIAVEGNAGQFVGETMKCGIITVGGNADDNVGEMMEGGTIRVNGNAGKLVGWFMRSSVITVEGNVGDKVGYCMSDGHITVGGNADHEVGASMGSGTITVGGNVGDNTGYKMVGGEIHLNGGYGGISEGIIHGKIFHKGKLIVDK